MDANFRHHHKSSQQYPGQWHQPQLPKTKSNLPALVKNSNDEEFNNEREILYKVLFDMKSDLNDLKKLTLDLMNSNNLNEFRENNEELIERVYHGNESKDNKKLNFVDFKDDNKKQNVINFYCTSVMDARCCDPSNAPSRP